MNTNSTNKLIEILELKQIKFDKGEKSLFRKYSYYQVINAYKNLFVKDIEYIDTIRSNILQNKNIEFYKNVFKIKPEIKTEELYEKICIAQTGMQALFSTMKPAFYCRTERRVL